MASLGARCEESLNPGIPIVSVAPLPGPLLNFCFDRKNVCRVASKARIHLVSLFFVRNHHPQSHLIQSLEIPSEYAFFSKKSKLRHMDEIVENRSKGRLAIEHDHIDERNCGQVCCVWNHTFATGAYSFVKGRIGNSLSRL